ncbi:MAG: phosphoribosylformylglycinamidine synthase subunit PurL [Candidatus Omnitrophica bacterium]|jgi:phosphoribosylformylglycinamidine synthase|nr:phosphoribosylformylglycinamidine synthase subunit PurL [Candidatus Omnitrophota bacterium]
MIWRIEVFSKKKESCPKIETQIKDLGFDADCKVYFKEVYLIDADLEKNSIEEIATKLLIDPVLQDYCLTEGVFENKPAYNQILITYNPGVCDPVAMSLEKAIRDLSLSVKSTRTAKFYEFYGLSEYQIGEFSSRILYNPLIEHIVDYDKTKHIETLDEFSGRDYKFKLIIVNILDADDDKLIKISHKGCLSLSLEEMKIIRDYFKKLNRNPTDCELETIATLWSEHCAHKTFRGIIEYEHRDSSNKLIQKEVFNNLLKSTIAKATKEINSLDCVSVFEDNSGIVKFDENNNICFKVETHNHPSALEPYGGASTGIGGVIRDILGTGSAARPFASVDVFCFSTWDISYSNLPQGLLHPKRIMRGVIRGVRDYGNRMGIPTVAGAVLFDERFLGNPLVYCGTLGLISKDKSFKRVKAGDLIILCGARTGRDGIHGATFSSKELDEQTVGLTSAVQIGNPIEEKKLTEAILRARDKNLFEAITDCGAGGISSAITELAKGYGAKVYLDKVPLKYRGLNYTEIWISESQERMVFFTTPDNLKEIQQIFEEEDVEISVVGEVSGTNKLTLFYADNKVCDLDMDFIFNLPKLKKQALWIEKKQEDCKIEEKNNYDSDLKNLISRHNIACKDWILREYDHEVQGGSVIKSIEGFDTLAVNDAAVVRPDLSSKKSVAVGLGINPFYSDIDPYWMAALALDEALRNVVCVGASLDKTFILDNFSWGSPMDKKVLGGLIRASLACYEFATYYGVPFISGKDSLYNEYMLGGKHISIPGTLLISAVSVISDWQNCITGSFKNEGNLVYIVGFTKPELGSSEYFRSLSLKKGLVPKVDKKRAKKILVQLSAAIQKGLILSCHDCSEGGLAVAISEMCLGSNLGASIFLGEVPKESNMFDYETLFSESPSRFIIEVSKDKKNLLEKSLAGLNYGLIGCVNDTQKLVIYNPKSAEIINLGLPDLRKSWMETFEEYRI